MWSVASAASKGWVWDRSLAKDGKESLNTLIVAPKLALEMRKNPAMKVIVCQWLFDYATPFFDGEYTFARHGLP